MEIVNSKDKFEINNVDELTVEGIEKCTSKHGTLLPDTVRCIISGPSSSGKSNILFNLLTHPNGLRFNNVYIFCKSLNQPKYQLLEKILANVPEVSYFKFNVNEEVIPPQNAKEYSVFIFDDVACEKQNIMRDYFSMGRHFKIDSIYLGQTYSKIPKQLIRDNVNMLIVLKQDDKNLKHVHSDHVGGDMSFHQFTSLCSKAWEEPFGFVVIVKDFPINNGRYRIGFDRFVIIH